MMTTIFHSRSCRTARSGLREQAEAHRTKKTQKLLSTWNFASTDSRRCENVCRSANSSCRRYDAFAANM